MIGLRRWLDDPEHDAAAEALEVDFTRYYGADFRLAMWGGPGDRWPPRRLLAHVAGLSSYQDSLYRAVMLGDKGREQTPELLVVLVNEIRAMRYEQRQLLGSGESKDRPPEMIELPEPRAGLVGEEVESVEEAPQREERKFASAAEIAAFLGNRGTGR